MELIKVISGLIATSGVLSLIGVGLVQLRKIINKYQDCRNDKLHIEAEVKINRENNRTALKLAEKGQKMDNDQSPSMTRAS
jgi:hypothetical protein